jgi:hypothetical protein
MITYQSLLISKPSMPLLMGSAVGLSCTVSFGLRSGLSTLDVATNR